MKKIITFFTLLLTLQLAYPCTTAIVSGKYTVDGRPLMLKNRDRSDSDNVLVTSKEGKYTYTAVVPLSDKANRAVMYGQNEAGLVVMNSTSYNLEQKTDNPLKKGNIMRWALERCATVDDFEAMIAELKYFDYGSNYGVMDAQGHAAYFECGHLGYKKYDVDDPAVAPHGYLVRSNFGHSGDIKEGKGFARYNKAVEILEQAYQQKNISWRTLINMTRCLQHGMTGVDLYDQMPDNEASELIVNFIDYIPRYSTMSAYVAQGVKPGEDPSLTIGWTCIALPLTTTVIPIWHTASNILPQCMQRNAEGQSTLVNWSNILKSYIWPWPYADGQNYIQLSHLINKQNTGLLQQTLEIEKDIVKRAEELIKKFRSKNKIDEQKLQQYYQWTDSYIAKHYPRLIESHNLQP